MSRQARVTFAITQAFPREESPCIQKEILRDIAKKFYWEPSREDKIGIVGGIFFEEGLSSENVVTLVDHFIDQAVDFYGALRSRLFDEQIEDFIDRVGVDKVGAAVVNTKHPPAFRPPDFRLGHLIEQGELMVQEQQRLRDMRLVREYNQALYESRHQGQASPVFFSSPDPSVDAPETPRDANRGDRAPALSNVASTAGAASASQPHTATPLAPDVAQQVQSLVAQGYPIGIEYVDPRRFNTGTWKSCNIISVDQSGDALTQLSACLHEHRGNYVRIFGIDSAKRRVMETVVQRP